MAPPAGLEPAFYSGKHQHLSDILSFGLWMRKEGFREATCRSAIQVLKTVNRRTDITNTEEVKIIWRKQSVVKDEKNEHVMT